MWFSYPFQLLRRRPKITLGTYGPFGWWPWRIPIQQFSTHMYIVGRSGSGKSKFIEGLLWQLITNGQGCAFIDPHADSANHLLKLLAFHRGQGAQPWLAEPKNAAKLVYCEPGRSDYVIPWNVFQSHADPYTVATNVWEAFRRTWSQSLTAAPQSKNIAIHSLLLLIEHGLTLADLPALFIDEQFRSNLVTSSRNPQVITFFKHRFQAWGKQGLQRAEPLLNKVTALTLNDHLRRMLGARDNRLNLRQIMDQGQVLIVNLGWCDQETRALMGSLLTVSLEQAAMSRVKLPAQWRRPFFCLIDEFQGFIDPDGSSHILSETRKAGLRFGLAHQGQYQLPRLRFQSTQEQTPMKVLFGCGAETARVIAKEVFTPKVGDQDAGSVTRQREEFIQQLKNLRPRQVLICQQGQPIRCLRTLTVPNPQVRPEQLEEVKIRLLKTAGVSVTDTDSVNARNIPPVPSRHLGGSFLG